MELVEQSSSPSVKVAVVVGRCATAECPTVYRTERGTLVIQGAKFEPGNAGLAVPDGEGMVEVPEDLLLDYAKLVR